MTAAANTVCCAAVVAVEDSHQLRQTDRQGGRESRFTHRVSDRVEYIKVMEVVDERDKHDPSLPREIHSLTLTDRMNEGMTETTAVALLALLFFVAW